MVLRTRVRGRVGHRRTHNPHSEKKEEATTPPLLFSFSPSGGLYHPPNRGVHGSRWVSGCGQWPYRMAIMACRISELVIDCRDPQRLAAFWCDVLGFTVLETDDDGVVEIGPPEGFGGLQPTLLFSPTTEPKVGKLRLHIDVNATDRDQDAELPRLLAAGARPVDIGQSGQESWHVLADPEGNEFCLLRTRLS